MPATPQWFLRLPDIIDELSRLSIPVIDRAGVESIFKVGRRRAIQLMHGFGGYQVGKTFIVDRSALVAELEAKCTSEAFEFERRRKARLTEELERTRRSLPGRQVQITVPPDVRSRVIADLPPGITLRPGELRIEFFGTEDLLRHLFELSQAILNDYKQFEVLVEAANFQTSKISDL
jgi:hypothetical protein